MRNQFVKLSVVLMVISGAAAAALALVDSFTAPRIEAAKQAKLRQALAEALPGAARYDEDKDFLEQAAKDDKTFAAAKAFYRAADESGNPAGVVVTVAPAGYGGPIETMVGIDARGKVQAVRVLSQTESPGLGTEVTSTEFLQTFEGAGIGEKLAVTKDGGRIAAIAGATVSSRAVTRAVNIALALAERAGI